MDFGCEPVLSALNLTTQRPKLQGFKPAVRRDSMLHVVRVRKHVVHRHGRWVRVIYVALYCMYDVHTAKNQNAGPVDLSCQLGAAGRSRARRRRASPDTRRPSSLQRDRYTFSIPTRCSVAHGSKCRTQYCVARVFARAPQPVVIVLACGRAPSPSPSGGSKT